MMARYACAICHPDIPHPDVDWCPDCRPDTNKELLGALKHILHTMDCYPNASDTEVMGAINWDYVRHTVELAEKQLAGGK